jgi:hypothetical protein
MPRCAYLSKWQKGCPTLAMAEPIEVEVRVDADGRATPRAFTWRGQRMSVVGVGRRWVEADGEHTLVMTPGERVFELLRLPDGRWGIVRAPDRPAVV